MARKESLFLFGCLFTLYAMSASGDLTGDTEMRWAVARRIVDTGWFDLPPETLGSRAVLGLDGKKYSIYGLGQPVCLLPFVVAGKCLAALPLPASMSADLLGQFLASLIFFPACGALAVILAYLIVLDATGERRVARWVAIIFGLATMHWHHTVNTYEESQVAVCLLACLWAAQRTWRGNEFRYPVLVLAASGVALCFRVTSVVLFAPLVLAAMGGDLVGRLPGRDRRLAFFRWMLAGVIAWAPFVIFVGTLNTVRFGSPLSTGYEEAFRSWALDEGGQPAVKVADVGLFETPMKTGLTGMLFSPGKSVFLYNPILLAAVPGFVGLLRSHRKLAICIAAVSALTLLFHSKVTFWGGDLAWGPRYLASAMGPTALALIPVLQRRWLPRVFAALVTVSVCVQVASIVYNFNLEFLQQPSHGLIPGNHVWHPRESHLWWRFRSIAQHAIGQPIYSPVPRDEDENMPTRRVGTSPEKVPRIPTVNIFPFKALANIGSKLVFGALLAVWLPGLALLGLLAYLWHRWLRSAEQTPQA